MCGDGSVGHAKRLLRPRPIRLDDGGAVKPFSILLDITLCTLAFGSWVISVNMQPKLVVALHLKVPHRLIDRFDSGRARRVEDPGAFGATPTSKTVMFDPYELT